VCIGPKDTSEFGGENVYGLLVEPPSPHIVVTVSEVIAVGEEETLPVTETDEPSATVVGITKADRFKLLGLSRTSSCSNSRRGGAATDRVPEPAPSDFAKGHSGHSGEYGSRIRNVICNAL
jgi:hypothetical protein